MKKFVFHGHAITITPNGDVVCETASIPFIIVRAIVFMVEHGIQKLVIDSAEIQRRQ